MNAAALFLAGMIPLLGQVALLRELSVAFFGIELIYLIAMGLWLLLAALGALAGRGKSAPPEGRMATLLTLFALLLPLSLVSLRASRILLGGVPGADLPFSLQMASLTAALAPAAFLAGLLFRAAALAGAERGRTLAGSYGIESLGGLAGGLAATLALRFGMQTFSLALLCALLAAGAAPFFVSGRNQRPRRWTALGLALILGVLLWQAAPFDRAMTRWNHPDLLASGDSPYGRITVSERTGQVAVFVNDALAFETGGTQAERFAHLAALQHPAPRRILLIGGGSDGTLGELLKHGPERIDWLEFDRRLIRLARSHLPREIQSSLDHPAVRLTLADPRRFLRQKGTPYDLILVGMPEPASGLANRFYTEEFFTECAARLAPGGIVALRLAAAGNIWTPVLIGRTASIQKALNTVFPERLVLPGEPLVITASTAPLPDSPRLPAERLRERGIATRLVTPPYLRDLWTNDRPTDRERQLAAADVPSNSDRRPVCYPYAVTIWLAHFFPGLALAELPLFGPTRPALGPLPWLIGLGFAVVFLLGRLWPAGRRWLLVAAAGFLGMAGEAVLLLAYQAREGALYQDIGLLLAAFMGGLALGAWAILEANRGKTARQAGPRRWGMALLAGFGLTGLAIIGGVQGILPVNLLTTAVLLLLTGFVVAGLLAYASLHGVREQRKVIAPLYAAVLVGGCLGSLLGSLLLIPLLGLDGTVLTTLLLAALTLLLI
jgi:spermidine synthase